MHFDVPIRAYRVLYTLKMEEYQYLLLVDEILASGNLRVTRNSISTLSLFGKSMRFSLENYTIPLLTTKKVFWKGIVEELLWFISGSTSAKELSDKGVNIWSHYGKDDLGPIYGHQWRRFGSSSTTGNVNTNTGVDQLAYVIDLIKNDPTSRRILMSSWNPIDIPNMVLPPCHVMCQFYVNDNELSCMLYQRSADMALGVPFNIASYALLTHMIAHITGLKAKELAYVMGDTHIYTDHIDGLKCQLTREPLKFPTIRFKREVNSIDDFHYEDIELVEYNHHDPIKFNMIV